MKHLLLTTIAVVLLVGCGSGRNIHDAAFWGNIEAVKQHLADGTDVNAKGNGGMTPLHFAANKEVAELLIAKGADVNAKDKYGRTPLLVAALNGHKEIVELLISKDADVNAKDGNGEPPLHYAVGGGHKEIVELLIDAGADVNAKDDGGMAPLHMAAANGHKGIAELLIVKGADVNAKIVDGGTPLDFAEAEIADFLRKHGAKTAEELKYRMTLFHIAAKEGKKETIELLIAKSADVNAKDADGRTPLDWAMMREQNETADLLRKHGGKTGEELKAAGK